MILAKGIVKTDQVTIEEQVSMFLHIVGHASNMRSVSYNFQRSLDTVDRTFNDVLWSIIEMRNDYIKMPWADATRHASVKEGTSFFPFKVCPLRRFSFSLLILEKYSCMTYSMIFNVGCFRCH